MNRLVNFRYLLAVIVVSVTINLCTKGANSVPPEGTIKNVNTSIVKQENGLVVSKNEFKIPNVDQSVALVSVRGSLETWKLGLQIPTL
jgi:hypothetical protein